MRRFGAIAIAGVGLIGGSIGMALRARGLADRVIGLGRDRLRLDEAKALGAIDEGTTDPSEAAVEAEIIVVCTPTDRIADDVKRLAAIAPADTLITDAGSAKGRILRAVEHDDRARRMFVGAHPLAGSERRGAVAAREDLFVDRVCVLTPTEWTAPELLERAERFWAGIGCRIVRMDPDAHDAALARTSHLPHLVASALALSVPAEYLPLAAGAYRDGTRVAASDPELWIAIFQENSEHLLDALDEYRQSLDQFRHALVSGDQESLRRLWSRSKALRERFQEFG